MKINEDNLAPVIIDLNIKSKGEVTESFLSILGHGIKTILRRMFWEDYGILPMSKYAEPLLSFLPFVAR